MGESKIHQAIIAVMREIGAIGKGSENQEQHYKYRSVEEVYNRVQPLFAKHGIFSYPKVVDQVRQTGKSRKGFDLFYSVLTIEYTFATEDGSNIAVTVVGEGMDSGDKASNKAMAAAHKYALCQVLNIPYEIRDPDQFTPDWAAKLEGRVTRAETDEFKKSWAKRRAAELRGKTETERRETFDAWLTETIGEHDANMVNPADGWRYWTPEQLEQCRAAEEAKRDE